MVIKFLKNTGQMVKYVCIRRTSGIVFRFFALQTFKILGQDKGQIFTPLQGRRNNKFNWKPVYEFLYSLCIELTFDTHIDIFRLFSSYFY